MPRSVLGIMTKTVESTADISDGRVIEPNLRVGSDITQVMGRNQLLVLVSSWKIQTQEPGNTTDQQKRRKKQVMPSKHLTLPPFLKVELV
ncbi:MAG TPA: hypothetical protein VEL31_07640 [Ktedonobacteraceae bacterium]|nr:hypothetical protein [Ktedonobacteraceae bacterium]